MKYLNKMYTRLFVTIVSIVGVFGDLNNSDEEYTDSVINLLLSENGTALVESVENNEVQTPFFIDGIWKCGECENITDMKLLYSEVNEIDIAYNDYEFPTDVQVGLAMDDMLCVTVDADELSTVRRESGKCDGDHVTLAVMSQQRFTVRVYGN